MFEIRDLKKFIWATQNSNVKFLNLEEFSSVKGDGTCNKAR